VRRPRCLPSSTCTRFRAKVFHVSKVSPSPPPPPPPTLQQLVLPFCPQKPIQSEPIRTDPNRSDATRVISHFHRVASDSQQVSPKRTSSHPLGAQTEFTSLGRNRQMAVGCRHRSFSSKQPKMITNDTKQQKKHTHTHTHKSKEEEEEEEEENAPQVLFYYVNGSVS